MTFQFALLFQQINNAAIYKSIGLDMAIEVDFRWLIKACY